MRYEEKYREEAEMYNDIIKRFENLIENDIEGAYQLSKDALQAYNRWSKIKHDVKKDLGRGELASFKERLEEMCKYLKEISVVSRMVWKYAKEDLIHNREDM